MDHGQNELISVIMPAYNARGNRVKHMFSRFRTIIWLRNSHYVDLFFNLLSDKSTDRRADITHSVMAVLRKDFIGFTRLPWGHGRLCRPSAAAVVYAT